MGLLFILLRFESFVWVYALDYCNTLQALTHARPPQRDAAPSPPSPLHFSLWAIWVVSIWAVNEAADGSSSCPPLLLHKWNKNRGKREKKKSCMTWCFFVCSWQDDEDEDEEWDGSSSCVINAVVYKNVYYGRCCCCWIMEDQALMVRSADA